MDLIGRTLPPSLACYDCDDEIDPRGGIYVRGVDDEVRPVCADHADGSPSTYGVEVERRSRPENEEEWDEWYVITSVPDAG